MAKESVTGAPATRRDSGFLLVHPNTLSTISSSGSGDGPPGTNQGTAPEVSTNMTSPPSLSHKEAAPVQGKPETCDMSTQTPERHISFSPKTCAELLYSKALSRDQLIHEYHYFKWRGVRLSTLKIRECSSSDFPPRINGELLIALNNQIYCDFSNTIEDFDIISNSVSYLAEKSMELAQTVGESEKDKSPVTPNSTTPSPTRSAELDPDETAFFSPRSSPKQRLEGVHDTPSSPGPISLPESVCLFIPELPFADLTVENVRETIPFEVTLRGGRKVSYYGSEPYSYGKTTHRSNPYLAGPLFERIFERLTPILGSDFTKENYSCLATLYENGSVGIPHHSDNESQIASDSTIHTISLGGKRTLQFRSTTGLFFEHNVELPHGSVYSMTTASQSAWSHSIVREQSISDPRISLTFRRMRSSEQADTDSTSHPAVERPVTVPPIKPPTPIKPLIAMGTHRRILLLTDSVLKDTPEHIFSRIADGSYRCVKKTGEMTSSSEYDSSITQQTFFLDCSKVIGDIIYITDTKFDEENGIIVGHSISEVGVFGAGDCVNIPDIAHMTTNAAFPIESDTVIEIKCNHPWFTLSGVEEITCVLDWTYNYNGGREPSCTQDVSLTCLPVNIKKGKSGILPVTKSRDHVTWDTVTWTVLDGSGSTILEGSCQTDCDGIFSFSKVETAGVHTYSVLIEKEGETVSCNSRFAVFGTLIYFLSS
ncbi:hypothetical protein ACHWQZ_G002694 [Mnemiopsis leidyi]